MKVLVEHLGGVQFQIKARQHKFVCDQPAENGGFDEGMTPPGIAAGFSRFMCRVLRCAVPEKAQPSGYGHAG